MNRFEILCVTMKQSDFSKINEMNITSDIVFANQCNHTSYEEYQFNNHLAKMISTTTKGVGINRNICLMYATADICLFADDDVYYYENIEKIIVDEFEKNPKADIFIFNLDTDDLSRTQLKYNKTKRCPKYCRMPWGAARIAFRLSSIRKANLWFNTLFGGGCVFPSGEDSIWLLDAKRKGLKFYVSKETIGKVSFEQSSWFTGYDENFFRGKGAYLAAMHKKTFLLRAIYLALRIKSKSAFSILKMINFMKKGKKEYISK